jgi:nitrate/nitrite-specific signal transduction histidine kinase
MSIRFKLTTIAIAVILVVNSFLSFVTVEYLGHIWLGEIQTRVLRNLNSAFLTLVVAATLANLVLLFLANGLVLLPIRRVVAMAQKVIGGDLSARVGIRRPGEMGVLCRAMDSMAQAVAERQELFQQETTQEIVFRQS